jgi:hypothetical protein
VEFQCFLCDWKFSLSARNDLFAATAGDDLQLLPGHPLAKLKSFSWFSVQNRNLIYKIIFKIAAKWQS